MSKLKSNTMGQCMVHNMMLKNLSYENKSHLLHLLKSMFQTAYVPEDWKKAPIIPILKPSKPSAEPESYRPISLTSCLGKIMERIVNKRLSWLLQKNGKKLKTQAGFHNRRSTMENIISLDHYIRHRFNQPKSLNTYTVFLDISKAFDSTWIQGLLYKLSNIGITGNILRWLSNLLRNRTYNVSLKIGVPQGSPLSPLLFSIMIDEFPILARPGETLLFADDIECHVHARDGVEAETILTLYPKEISNWS
uniref:Reverse transcriptase domain-containing protein n=1 Tax=Daphnia galeata TaxID=27404 RepID=A0A8J2S066_9CRUS|nr:unnamed protein product [Daphnia galeata]